MGVPMAAHLAAAGFTVQSYDKRVNGTHDSVRKAAEGADFLITMLPDGAVVRDVVHEALPALKRGALVIDMSSSDPIGTRALGKRLAASDVAMVDAPVSGAVRGAREASLAIMCGGSARDVARARPALEKMGRDIFHVGPLGAGHAVKALNNYLGAAGTLAGFEALLLAQALDLDPKPVLDAINASTGRNWTTEHKIPQQVLTGAFGSGFKLALMTKDVAIASALARDLGIDTPYLRETLKHWRAAARAMPRDADHTEIYKFQKKQSLTLSSKRRSAAVRGSSLPSRGARARRARSR